MPLALLGVFVVAALLAGGVVGYVFGFAQGQDSAAAMASVPDPPAPVPGDTEVAVTAPPAPVTREANPVPGPPESLSAPASAESAGPPPAAGTLVVDSRPRGAVVTVNGRRRGVTPLRLPDVEAGSYVVRLQLTGYRTISGTVDVRAGEQARLAVTLESADDARRDRAPGGVEH